MNKNIFILLLFCSFLSAAQNCKNSIYGTVKDHHDGSLLVGATLTIKETGKASQTDIYGRFSIENLCAQNYTILITHMKCDEKEFSIAVDGKTEKIFKLEHHKQELNEITVNGKAYKENLTTVKENVITEKELEKFSNGSFGDALNSLSGVSSLNTGNTVVKPLINGLHSSRVVIMNNGIRMQDQEWGAEHAPNIDINTVEKITLIKGAGALQYSGDAVGGVIVAESTKNPVKDSIYGKTIFNAASNGRGSAATTQLTKTFKSGWYAKAQGTIKRYGDFEAPEYVLSNTGIFERNVALRAGFNGFSYGFEANYSLFKNEIGILRASHIGGAQDQVNAINNNKPSVIRDFTYTINAPKQDVTHQIANIKGYKRFDNIGKLNFQYNYQQNDRLEYDIRRGDDKNKASVDLKLVTHDVLLDLDSKLSHKANLKTGTMLRYKNNFANPNTGVRRLIPDYDKYEIGAYAVTDYNINEQLTLEAGARFDYVFIDAKKIYRSSLWESKGYDELYPDIVIEETNNQIITNPKLDFYNASATLGGTYKFNKNYNLFLNYSLASRAPNPSELFSEGLHHSASRIEIGDLRFESEISQKIGLTFERKNKVFNFSVNPFLHSISDFIVLEPTSIRQTIRGNFQVWEYRQTDAQLLGFDIDATYKFAKNFQFNHQFSFVKGYDVSNNDEPLINMPPINTKNEIVYQNKKINNLRLGLQSEYVFEQNEYPDNNFEVYIPQTETYEIVDISTPPNAYHLLNFNSSIDIKATKNSILTVGLNITNVLNTSYRNYLNRMRYYADDLGRNFLLNLKLNY